MLIAAGDRPRVIIRIRERSLGRAARRGSAPRSHPADRPTKYGDRPSVRNLAQLETNFASSVGRASAHVRAKTDSDNHAICRRGET